MRNEYYALEEIDMAADLGRELITMCFDEAAADGLHCVTDPDNRPLAPFICVCYHEENSNYAAVVASWSDLTYCAFGDPAGVLSATCDTATADLNGIYYHDEIVILDESGAPADGADMVVLDECYGLIGNPSGDLAARRGTFVETCKSQDVAALLADWRGAVVETETGTEIVGGEAAPRCEFD